jgi:hypothetical protein
MQFMYTLFLGKLAEGLLNLFRPSLRPFVCPSVSMKQLKNRWPYFH